MGYLEKYEVTDNGIYLENCKYVNYGFFGSLAVVSHDAAATYMANLDDCKAALNYMGHEKVTGNQAWGEDLFQQRCMDLHGVDIICHYHHNKIIIQQSRAIYTMLVYAFLLSY